MRQKYFVSSSQQLRFKNSQSRCQCLDMNHYGIATYLANLSGTEFKENPG